MKSENVSTAKFHHILMKTQNTRRKTNKQLLYRISCIRRSIQNRL